MLPNITGMFLRLSKTKSMTFERSKAVSNIFIRCLIAFDEINIFCHFLDICGKFVESNTNTKSVDLVRSDETSYEDVRYGFGTPKGHTFSLGKSQEHPCDVG